jgi:hypothetical protein
MPIEGLVRANQRVDLSPSPAALPAASNGGTGAVVQKQFGRTGSVQPQTGTTSIQITYYVVHRPEEQDGETTQSEPPV